MTAGAGLVVNCDGSGCRLVEFDSDGRVVGPGESIRLSERDMPLSKQAATMTATATATTTATEDVADLARLLDKVRLRLLTDALEEAIDDPQGEFDRLAEVYAAEADGDLAVGYQRAARAHPSLWQAAREAAYLDDRPRGR